MPVGLSEEEIDTIIETGDWVFMAEERPKQIANFHSRQVMSNIARFIRSASEQESPLRFVLLSAHDSTIASALSFMGAPLFKSPPYASDLNFSMFEGGAKNYVVKITYNGKPVTIPSCGGTVCSLQKFLEIVENTT
jgi:acid phosphatase